MRCKVDSFPAVSWLFFLLLSVFENLALEDRAGKNNGILVRALGWERREAGEEQCFEDAGRGLASKASGGGLPGFLGRLRL